jgi:cytochrome c oxidase subunit 2
MRDFISRLILSSSAEESLINSLFEQYLLFAGFIVALIGGIIIIAVIRFRAARRPDEPPQVAGNRTLETAWTLFPFVAVTYFFVVAVGVMRDINLPVEHGAKPDIEIIAHQWWWEMRYPKNGIVTANELHIPVGKKLLVRVISADVIHDWWVPALGRKIDAVPGHPNYTWIETTTPGLYTGTCSEYCGTEHAWMRTRVVAEGDSEFDRWVRDHQVVPVLPTDSLGLAGARLFQRKACAVCHTIAGTPATGDVGPDLSHLASRQTILSGMLPNTAANLTRFLSDPQKVKQGVHMPDFFLTKAETKELVDYLGSLK